MKFKIFKLRESIYKKVVYTGVFVLTVACIVVYLQNRTSDEIADISFILSIVYALSLFLVGLNMNNLSIQTQNMFYKRKELYKRFS